MFVGGVGDVGGGEEVAGDLWAGGAGDEFVAGWGDDFVGADELFVEFFAGAEAGVDDFDVFAGLFDHLFGDVGDADGFAHIKNECIAVVAYGTGLDDELYGFGDGHEVAGDVAVGHGDWSAVFDLCAEGVDEGAA